MEIKLMSLACVQLTRLFGLFERVEPVELEGRGEWGLLIRGRGFTRLLGQEILNATNLIRPVGWSAPRPYTFRSRHSAANHARNIGLLASRLHGECANRSTETGRAGSAVSGAFAHFEKGN